MKEKFKDSKLTGSIKIKMDEAKGTWEADKETIVSHIIRICEEYQRQRDTLTLRQLYYQLVANDIIPNHDKVYKKLGGIKDDVVYAGLVDWSIFEDRGRKPMVAYYEDSVAAALGATARIFRLHKQDGQPNLIEVWTEKDAISGILNRVCNPYNVDLVVNKGYSSSTAMYDAYDRFVEEILANRKVIILYFGDHDPSGLDMIRDIRERLMFMFTNGEQLLEHEIIQEWWEREEHTYYDIADVEGYEDIIELFDSEESSAAVMDKFEQGKVALFIKENDLFQIKPIGLTMEQIKYFNPPPNPAKITDPRAAEYVRQHGNISWEVDALTPSTMREIVEKEIKSYMDLGIYEKVLAREVEDKAKIIKIVEELKEEDEE